MTVVSVKEDTCHKVEVWASILGVDPTALTPLIDGLILRRTDVGTHRLAFVGIVIFPASILLSRPKFDEDCSFAIMRILSILRSYFRRRRARRPVVGEERDPEYGDDSILREFDAMSRLREWWVANGIYSRHQSRASIGGRPNWVRTLAKQAPLISSASVLYPLVSSERRRDAENDISALQVGVTTQLMRKYGIKVPPELLGEECSVIPFARSWPPNEAERSFHLQKLMMEQRRTFRSDALVLLSLLRETLDTRLASASPRPQIYGTTAFYSVWEDACRVLLGSDLDPGKVAGMGMPNWIHRDENGTTIRTNQVQRPDIVVRRDGRVIVVDAKYYFPFPNSRPGAQDIAKQLVYAESLAENEEGSISLFVMPMPKIAIPEFLGCATISGSLKAFDLIEAWGLAPEWLFACYPHLSTDSNDRILRVIMDGRPLVAKLFSEAPPYVGG